MGASISCTFCNNSKFIGSENQFTFCLIVSALALLNIVVIISGFCAENCNASVEISSPLFLQNAAAFAKRRDRQTQAGAVVFQFGGIGDGFGTHIFGRDGLVFGP